MIEPLDVFDFHNFMARSYLILTDSGGIQAEAPSLGKPVLVMRDKTERPEGIKAGTLRLVGTDDPETFEMVQREMARRTKGRNRHSGVHLFSGKIKCGDCGGWYGSKVWHSNDVYKRTIWQCNQKYKNEKRCTTPFLDEATIKARFLTAANILLAGRSDAIRTCEAAIKTVFDLTDLLAEQARLHGEMELLSGMMEESIRQNATVALDQAEYQKRFDDLSQRFDTVKQQHSEVSDRISDLKSRKGEMMDFLKLLKKQEDEVTVFSDGLWTGLLDYTTIYADGRMTFTFKNGQTIDG